MADETVTAAVLVHVGDYALSVSDDETFWLMRKSGEGLEVSARELEALLGQYFEENF